MFRLKRIQIKNFQSHEDTELFLSLGVNAVVGRSNVGKTSIIRAFRWVSFFQPPGFRFRSRFVADKKDPTKVELEFEDGNIVSLSREGLTTSQSIYRLNGEEFKAFRSVPQEIQEVLSFSEINFQHQLDPHFLITSTPGEVARAMNKIIRVDDVDRWVSSLTTKINSFNKEITILTTQKDELEKELSELDFLPLLEKEIGKASIIKTDLENTRIRFEKGREILDGVRVVRGEMNRLEAILGVERRLLEAERVREEARRTEQFLKLIRDLHQMRIVLKQEGDFLQTVEPRIEKAENVLIEIRKTDRRKKSLLSLLSKIEEVQELIKTKKKNLSIKTELFKGKILEIGQCPLCGNTLDDSHLASILEGI